MHVKKDAVQIARSEHDAEANARRCKLVDAEFAIELDHNDGDSVTVHPDKLVVSSVGVTSGDVEVIPALPCSSLKRVQLYVNVISGVKDCTLVVQVSPVDNDNVWFDVFSLTGSTKCSSIIDICARRIRVVQSQANGNAELNVHLVGQG